MAIFREPTRVYVIEAFEIMRWGLRTILDSSDDIEVIGEATDVETAIPVCMHLHPDVVLLDTTLPRRESIQAIQAISDSQPDLPVLVLVCPDDQQLIEASMQSTAIGCLTKNISGQELIRAIHLARSGKSALIRYATRRRERIEPSYDELTQREQEILSLLVHGLTNRQIAERLEVSHFTIKNHVSNLLTKLGASSRTKAVTLALQQGLVQMD